MSRLRNLTNEQCEWLVERVEDFVDSNSYDWQLETSEHNGALRDWADIVRELGFEERASKLYKDYSI